MKFKFYWDSHWHGKTSSSSWVSTFMLSHLTSLLLAGESESILLDSIARAKNLSFIPLLERERESLMNLRAFPLLERTVFPEKINSSC